MFFFVVTKVAQIRQAEVLARQRCILWKSFQCSIKVKLEEVILFLCEKRCFMLGSIPEKHPKQCISYTVKKIDHMAPVYMSACFMYELEKIRFILEID